MSTADAEHKTRNALDSWKFWVGIAYFGLVAVIVALYFLNRDVSRQAAEHAAEQKAAAVSQSAQCYLAFDSKPEILAIIDSLGDVAQNSIKSSLAAIKADPKSPLVGVRRAAIKRNWQALRGVQRFRATVVENTKTREECDALSLRLGLQPRRGGSR